MSLVQWLVAWVSHKSVGYGAPSVTDPPGVEGSVITTVVSSPCMNYLHPFVLQKSVI